MTTYTEECEFTYLRFCLCRELNHKISEEFLLGIEGLNYYHQEHLRPWGGWQKNPKHDVTMGNNNIQMATVTSHYDHDGCGTSLACIASTLNTTSSTMDSGEINETIFGGK